MGMGELMAVKTMISDQLIIRACNTVIGSGGVKRWNNKVGFAALRTVKARAEVGNPLNHMLDPLYVPGCYRNGFQWTRGGNQHKTWTIISNICPHATYVERGRGVSHGFEVFTWAKIGGHKVIAEEGTRGFKGNPILFPTVNQVAKRLGMRGGVTLRSVVGVR